MAAKTDGADKRPMRFTTIRVRLYPTQAQAELFEKTFHCCRYIWNRMLSDQERFYLETDVHFIPTPAKYKKEAPFLTEVDNQALTQEYNHLARAFRQFFKNPGAFRHPKYKSQTDRDSFTACNHFFESGPTIYTTRDGIRMTKAGIVQAKFPQRPRNGWKLKRITVEKTKTGKYFCCILYEYPARESGSVSPTPETTLGLKYSSSHFYVSDDGSTADPPKWLKDSQARLARLQQKLSRMEPGSKNYRETVQKLRKIHEHIANQRRDYIHKESRKLAGQWDAVCVREDDLQELTRKITRGSTVDAGFGRFRECLRYKLERQGKQLLTVDRYTPTTRTCSVCGAIRGEVRERTWTCPECGAVHDREVNAAKNIKAEGLAQIAHDR